MADDGGKVDISIVKVLRSKCDDLEEKLDAAEEERDEANAAKEELEEEVEKLREKVKEFESSNLESSNLEEALKAATAKASEAESSLNEANKAKEDLEVRLSALEKDFKDAEAASAAATAKAEAAEKASEEALHGKEALEGRLASAEQDLKDRDAALAAEGDDRIQSLQSALNEEQERRGKLQACHEELEASKRDVERKLQESLEKVKSAEEGLKAAENKLLEADKARGEQLAGLEKALAEKDKEMEEVKRLQKQNAEAGQGASKAVEEENVALKERLTKAEAANSELQQSLVSLKDECEELVSDRDNALERMQSSENLQNDTREELALVQRAMAEAKRRTIELSDGLEAERKCHADQAASHNQLQVHCQQLNADLQAIQNRAQQQQVEFDRVLEAYQQESKKSKELEAHLQAIQPMHEDLFTRYSAAVEQLDNLKGEKQAAMKQAEQLAMEKDEISKALDEERENVQRVHQDLKEAEAVSSQLTVNDVLISIDFEGEPAPLELKPWDTNFEDVVTDWLKSVQRSPNLSQSLVRYLKHLEETCEAFPVRKTAKLLEVHEEFAI